jgi:hypothetical protein
VDRPVLGLQTRHCGQYSRYTYSSWTWISTACSLIRKSKYLLQRLHKLTKLSVSIHRREWAVVAQALPHVITRVLGYSRESIGDTGLEAISAGVLPDTPKACSARLPSWNNLTVKGVTALARYWEQDTCVQKPHLSCNTSIGDDSVDELCRAHEANRSRTESLLLPPQH